PSVAELTRTAAATPWLGKSIVVTAILLTAGLLTGAGLWTYHPWVADAPAASPEAEEAAAAKVAETATPAPSNPETAKSLKIQGSVLAPDGKPKAGAKLLLLGHDGAVKQLGVSAADGHFTIAVPDKVTWHWGHWVVAQADGAAIDFVDLYQLKLEKPVEL